MAETIEIIKVLEITKDNNVTIDNSSPIAETLPYYIPNFSKNTPVNLHNRMVDFGKHKSLTFHELVTYQSKYVVWLLTQTWFDERYPELYEYVNMVGTFEKPQKLRKISDPDKEQLQIVQTHNQLQIRFTDNNNLLNLVKIVLGEEHEYTIRSVTFEHWCGVDIEVLVTQITANPGYLVNSTTATNHTLLFEIKPSVSEDYPDILRQIRRQLYSHGIFRKQTGAPDENIVQVLVTQRYDGTIPLEDVRTMYGNVKIVVVE